MSLTNFDTAGATSLHTTVEDLAQWDANFDHSRIGGSDFLEQMLHRDKLNNGDLQDYASGLAIGTYKGLATVGHGGADAGYRSNIVRFPDQHLGISVLCNFADANPGALTNQVADILLAKDFKTPATPAPAKEAAASAPVAPLTTEQMAAIAGTYWYRDGDDFALIEVKDSKLQIEIDRDNFHELKPFAPDHFHIAGVPWGNDVDVHFMSAETGKPRRMEVKSGDGKPETAEAVTPFAPTAAQLAEYPGAFVSEEIDPVYRISLKDGKLTLERLKHKPDALRPTTQDVFTGDIGTVRFTRDAKGQITGFILNAGRIQNFRFTKRTT